MNQDNAAKAARKNESFFVLCLFFAALCLKYLIYGFNYFPVLDDYIQYGGYPLYHNLYHVLFNIGTIATRPAASFLDVAFWGQLWKVPGIALFLLTCLHFASGLLFKKTLAENRIPTGSLFLAVYLLFPLGTEGTYWISSSTRLVIGLFFVSLSLYTLTKYINSKRVYHFVLFICFTFVSYFFYESVTVFGFFCGVFITLSPRTKGRRVAPLCFLLFLLAAVFVYYIAAAPIGNMGSRTESLFLGNLFLRLGDFFKQVFTIMTKGLFDITFRGFASGLSVLISHGLFGIFYILVILAVCFLIGKYSSRTEIIHIKRHPFGEQLNDTKEKGILKSGFEGFFSENLQYNKKAAFLIGIFLFFAPFAPNILSDPVWLTYRSLFVPILALALILDIIFDSIKKRGVRAFIICALSFVFIVSGINEYDTYRRVYSLDSTLLNSVATDLPLDVLDGERDVAVLLDSVPQTEQVSYYKDHVKSVFYTDWALTGAVRAYLGNMKIRKVTPVFPDMTFDLKDCFVVDLRGKG